MCHLKALQKLLFLFSVVCLIACEEKQVESVTSVSTTGNTVGSWQLVDGSTFNRTNKAEKLLFINYWAEWCKPCIAEIPELNRFKQNYGQFVDVVGVNYDGLKVEALKASADKLGIEYSVAIDNMGKPWLSQLPEALPATLVIAADNSLCATLLGEQSLDTLLEAAEHCGFKQSSLKPGGLKKDGLNRDNGSL
ncbi:MAG: TlpA family protein disulfide reductase [Cellvibrionaceae bacterium]